jgi:hypothetical protein
LKERNITNSSSKKQFALVMETGIDSPIWGNTESKTWDTTLVHPLMVARGDKEDITANQVGGLCQYCQEVLERKMPMMAKSPDRASRVKFINNYLRFSKFEGFFEKLKQKKLAAGDLSWKNAFPPQPSIKTLPDADGQITASRKKDEVRKQAEAPKPTDSQTPRKIRKPAEAQEKVQPQSKAESQENQDQQEVNKPVYPTKRKRDN